MKLWVCIMTTEFDIIVPESAASLIGLITLEMKLTVKAQCGKSARWVCRGGGWRRALEYRASLRPYLWGERQVTGASTRKNLLGKIIPNMEKKTPAYSNIRVNIAILEFDCPDSQDIS